MCLFFEEFKANIRITEYIDYKLIITKKNNNNTLSMNITLSKLRKVIFLFIELII
jgi:hypothetical protein